jgi:hypothetical protein
MAHSASDPPIDDQRLVQYLLGALAEEDAERLDELSVADDEIAGRLRALENDLVDAFVRGELSDAVRAQVHASYLASPRRRDKVGFAEALLAFEKQHARLSSATDAAAAVATTDESRLERRRRWRLMFVQWAPVAAALVAAVTAASFVVENQRLRREMGQSKAERTNLEQSTNSLRTELERERSASARIRDERSRRDPFVLSPMRRGADDVTTVALSGKPEQVSFRLGLESDDFPSYLATLRDASDARVIWRSQRLDVPSTGTDRFVAVQVPAALLKSRAYTFELAGSPARGPAAFVTSYAFRIVLE